MALLYSSHPFTKESKQRAVRELLAASAPDREYYVLLLGAILLAIGAIFTDSIPVLIASMIVAPLAAPILAVGLGIATGNWSRTSRALIVLGFSCVVALGLAMIVTILFGNDRTLDLLISFNGNREISFLVAVISGAVAAYGTVEPKVGSAATGIAIAVSLMPPLVATGISMVPGGAPLQGAPTLFLLNVIGIATSSALTFRYLGIRKGY